MRSIQLSKKHFDDLWRRFLAYQAQLHARDFVTKNPRNNKARFIKIIRALVSFEDLAREGIDIELLSQDDAKSSTHASVVESMKKLCSLIEQNEAFMLENINADENSSVMSFKNFNAAQWKAFMEDTKRKEQSPSKTRRPPFKKNTRQRIDPLSALAVDVQQQNEVQNSFQLQNIQSNEYQNEQQHALETPASQQPAISFAEFWDIVAKEKSLHPLKVTQDDLHHQWCHWSAGKNTCTKEYKKTAPKRALKEGDIQFTRSAAMELLKWRHLFQAGIDINHLPAGFYVKKSKVDKEDDVYLLHYLPELKEITEPDKLAIQCNKPLSFPANTKSHLSLDDVKDLFKEYSHIDEDSIKHLYEYVLQYFPDKETLQKNKEYMQSIQIILNLPPSQRKWWEQLFEQHTKNCGQDDFPSLAASFLEFLEKLKQYQQHFDFYPPKFSAIKSMPVALSQMLALLDLSKNEDRQTQWNCITQLHLTGYEVGIALRKSERKSFSARFFSADQRPCSFILPIMKIEEVDVFSGRYDLLFAHQLDWSLSPLDPKLDLDIDHEQLFYLVLSHKAFRLPLSFYQEKINAIKHANFDEVTKRRLYFLLVESCTGATPEFTLKSQEQIDTQWRLFVRNITKMGKKESIAHLYNLEAVPDIFSLNKVVEDIASKASSDLLQELKNSVFYLNRFNKSWDSIKATVLLNKKDTTSIEDLWQIKVCFEYYEQVNYLHLVPVFDFLPELNKSGNGPSFKADLATALEKGMEDERHFCLSERIIDKLSCLALPKGKPYLTGEQFINFVNAVYEEALNHQTDATSMLDPNVRGFKHKRKSTFDTFYTNSEFIDPILRAHFPEYVDEDLLGISVISADELLKLEQRIKARVKDKSAKAIIKDILTELSCDRCRKEGHSELVDKLIILTNNYPGEARSEFLLSIRNQLAFGKLFSKESNRGYGNRLDQLDELLQIVIDTGSTERLEFLIAEFENLPKPHNQNCLKKCSYALQRLLGLMNEELSKGTPHIQLTEQLLLCKEFISAHGANHLLQIQNTPIKSQNDETLFIEMIQAINTLSKEYPMHARALNSFFIRGYRAMNQMAGEERLTSSLERTIHLCNKLYSLKDADLILSIIHTFVDENNANLFSIQSLDHLFNHCPSEKQAEFFKILLGQTNQNLQRLNQTDIDAFLSLINQENNNALFSEALTVCFAQLPFPTLSTFTNWWAAPDDNRQSIKEQYQAFLQQPFPRDEKNNGFIVDKAKQQVKSKEMANIASRYTDQFIDEFHQNCTTTRALSFSDLTSTLQSAKNDENPARFIITMAELFFRSTGQEINTTQYLALDALLSSGQHITSEIDTGEGKTRIAMLLLATRAYAGQTCDFVTSDMQLAESAYLSYHGFFKMLGIPCHLIRSESNIAEYQEGAIHFSDCGNLSLFRNKATAARLLHKTLDSNPAHRTLLLDESDKTWFDLYDTSYNFSMPADKTLEDMGWVYPQLIQFFSEDGYTLNPDAMNFYYEDIALCTQKFREFINTFGTHIQAAQLSRISDEQISRWHEAAVLALHLRYKVDFVIEPNTRVRTHKGPKVASEALVMADNQVSRHSKFSNGVHQCLHARLNILRHKEIHEKSTPLDAYLHDKCTQAFHIAPENQIIATSSSETFLSFYRQGNTYGMTGTAGAEQEKREVEEYFGVANAPDKKHFIKMPRQKTNLRVDNPITIVEKKSDKIAVLVQHILEAQSKNQPILIFCDNDHEATLITDQLNQHLQKAPDSLATKVSITQVNSTMPLSEQTAYLANDAGKPAAITISTGMLGRGKDILLRATDFPKRDAMQYGLKTIDLSYPNYRELRQRLGRAARNGEPGETHILLSEEELKATYRLRYSKQNLQHIELLLLKRQHFETDKNQLERRAKMSLHEYVGQYQTAYFNHLLPLLKKNDIEITDEHNTIWVKFFHETVLMKQKALNDLMGIIHNPSFSAQKFNRVSDELHTSVLLKWDEVITQLAKDLALAATMKQEVNPLIHKATLQDWEKQRLLEIKNEQLRPLRARIIVDEIKSKESWWVFFNRKLFEFAQWISWDSLAQYLDKHFQFTKPVTDTQIASLIYSPVEESVIQEPPLEEPQHTDLFNKNANANANANAKVNTPRDLSSPKNN